MKEIDGLIACSRYGVIEWLCRYDQTVNVDVAGKRSARSRRGGTRAAPSSTGVAESMALGTLIRP